MCVLVCAAGGTHTQTHSVKKSSVHTMKRLWTSEMMLLIFKDFGSRCCFCFLSSLGEVRFVFPILHQKNKQLLKFKRDRLHLCYDRTNISLLNRYDNTGLKPTVCKWSAGPRGLWRIIRESGIVLGVWIGLNPNLNNRTALKLGISWRWHGEQWPGDKGTTLAVISGWERQCTQFQFQF